ncbi:CBS domain-containing protein [Methanobacterium formicicum]|uniref:CBS domain-containing membrane protein n=1 Tax=Methanobacterium formicicum (strain DSM 3637 / PP1) TaxID=1204725 RepID=K2R504_METFP|nr:CBS domain-containing protein [Methanobacterium formicicum]EKF86282.1 CBS domain-containing membrane protein [Methanobacterium formicicum DSM 3637]
MKIQDAMEKEVIKFQVDDRIVDVAGSLRENKISGAPVMNKEDQLVGIISEGDIMRLLEIHSPHIRLILPSPLDLIELPVRMKYEMDEIAEDMNKAASVLIGEIMTKKVVTIDPDSDISDAAQLMDTHDVKRLPVVDSDGKMVGIITRGDIIGAMVRG